MPVINVREQDKSWYYAQRSANYLTVYAFGFTTFGPEDSPKLVDSDDFTSIFGSSVSGVDSKQYEIVRSYLANGATVLFQRLMLEGNSKASKEITKGVVDTESITVSDASTLEYTLTKLFTSVTKVTITSNETTRTLSTSEYSYDAETKKLTLVDVTLVVDDIINVDGSLAGIESNLKVKAKFSGSFGNKISVKFTQPRVDDTSNLLGGYIKVFINNNLMETASIYDYNELNYTSNYIDLEVNGELDISGIDTLTTYELSGGLDYSIDTEDVNTLIDKSIKNFIFNKDLSDISDPLLYSLDVITSTGFYGRKKYTNDLDGGDGSVSTLDLKLANVAFTRGDCIYLVDGATGKTIDGTYDGASEFYSYCTTAGFSPYNDNLLKSYNVGIGPWTKSTLVSTGRVTDLPGSYSFITEWCNSINRGNPAWLPPAGVKRASISTINSTVLPIGRVVLDTWQSNNKEYKVNPIMRLKQYGFTIYGDSTLLPNKPDGSTSMLQQVSVRVLANKIKQRAFDISLNLQFDQMTSQVLLEFKTLLSTYMDELKYQGGLYDYEIIIGNNGVFTLTDLNTKTIPVIIRISPTPAVENFDITLEVNQAGVTFGTEV